MEEMIDEKAYCEQDGIRCRFVRERQNVSVLFDRVVQLDKRLRYCREVVEDTLKRYKRVNLGSLQNRAAVPRRPQTRKQADLREPCQYGLISG